MTTNGTSLPPNLTVTRHALPPGDGERQIQLLERNAGIAKRFGDDRRAAYAAMVSLTPIENGILFSRVENAFAHGWWAMPKNSVADNPILFIHGGGYHLGDAGSYNGFVSQIAARTGRRIFSLDYPLAPEHHFPAAYDSALRAMTWLLEQGHSHISLMGDSAGGGLTLALLNEIPVNLINVAVVFSPWTDLALTGKSFNDPATVDPVFKTAVLANLAKSYLGGADDRDFRASPLYRIPQKLPPLAVQVGNAELLRDDAERYALMASERGSKVRLDIFEGMHHVFQRDVEYLRSASHALNLAAKFVSEH